MELLRTYKLETDPLWFARQQQLNKRLLVLSNLDTERTILFNELQAAITGLTKQEKTQVQLARWQRALELCVYAPLPTNTAQLEDDHHGMSGVSSSSSSQPELDLWGFLEKLLGGISEEDEMSDILSEASSMCETLVNVTKQITNDAGDQILQVDIAIRSAWKRTNSFCKTPCYEPKKSKTSFASTAEPHCKSATSSNSPKTNANGAKAHRS
jgi:hypothetical protein